MARYDEITPKDILERISKKNKEGFFVQRLNDKKQLAQHYEIILKDKINAEKIYDMIRRDLNKPFLKSPKGSSKEMALFLRDLQNKDTGSFVEYPTIFSLEIERAKHILRHLNKEGLKPKYPLKFLNKINTGKKLKQYFKELLFDFSKNNELELNLVITGLPTIKELGFYPFSKDWDDVYFYCLEIWQDPKTGYWGPWIKKKDKIIKLTDISTTFHILRLYYDKKLELNNPKKDMKYKTELLKTTWDIKNKNWPYGWLQDRCWDTHHNFDIVEIFLYFFNKVDSIDKDKVRKLFHRFLNWDLNTNLQKNGGFIGHYKRLKKPTIMNTNFAILVLRGIGYYSSFNRNVLWSGVKLPINSYRIYTKKISENEFDTSNIKCIIYAKKSTLDPLHTRIKIFKYWKKHKHENPSDAMNINLTLEFEKHYPKNIEIKQKIPKLKPNEILVAVDKFGGIVWTKGYGALSISKKSFLN